MKPLLSFDAPTTAVDLHFLLFEAEIAVRVQYCVVWAHVLFELAPVDYYGLFRIRQSIEESFEQYRSLDFNLILINHLDASDDWEMITMQLIAEFLSRVMNFEKVADNIDQC